MKSNLRAISSSLYKNQHLKTFPIIRYLSTQEACERRNHLFTLEKKRQVGKVGRIEKIEVKYKGVPEDCTLIMNKDLSTPYDCARHLSEWHSESSALALLDGAIHWDMHKPLSENCTLELQNFTSPEPQQVNKAFWRTCSLVMGACASVAFKDNFTVKLHSFSGPDIRSGSFIYDIDIPELDSWEPNSTELRALSAEFIKICRKSSPIERLEVTEPLALEMFKDNEYKTAQIPSIAKANGNVTLYRVDNHVDISKGPMINNTSQIGRVTVASVHKIVSSSEESSMKHLYRFQGVALPTGIILNHFAYKILEDRAKKLNKVRSPSNPLGEFSETEQQRASA